MVIVVTLATPKPQFDQRAELIRTLKEQQARLGDQLKQSSNVPSDVVRATIASLQIITSKLSDPVSAATAYAGAAQEAKAELDKIPQIDSQRIQRAKEALDRVAPATAKALFKEAAMKNLGEAAESLYQAGRLAEVDGNISEAYDNYQSALTIRPNDSKIASALQAVAFFLGKYDQAASLLENLRRMKERVGSLSPVDLQELDAAHAAILLAKGQFPEAEQSYLMQKQRLDVGAQTSVIARARLLSNLGSLYQNWGRYSEAKPLLIEALELILSAKGPDDLEVALSLNNLAFLRIQMNELNSVESDLREAERIITNKFGPSHFELIIPLNNTARYFLARKQIHSARTNLAEAERIAKDAFDQNHPLFARTLDLLSDVNVADGQYQAACLAAERALKLKSQFFGDGSLEFAFSLLRRASCRIELNAVQEANGDLQKAKQIVLTALASSQNARMADVLFVQSIAFIKLADYPRAIETLKDVISIRMKLLGLNHPSTLEAEKVLGDIAKSPK
ncbi:tetratricopeptide repeat protein [Bradyrhizobium sp. 138]|uniref:tetratricopeptide repeat protein n=1 Tax=Bradyrhizobium sp. 138 TaxID=2782615 RepID=UPI001FF98992|nr:tetratricopeptide repeat protein [Bradyrhizobium sp. 138]MCK1733082.1 tetratricopeptide repeat protein [Bradyrhizobium sp. 138]